MVRVIVRVRVRVIVRVRVRDRVRVRVRVGVRARVSEGGGAVGQRAQRQGCRHESAQLWQTEWLRRQLAGSGTSGLLLLLLLLRLLRP